MASSPFDAGGFDDFAPAGSASYPPPRAASSGSSNPWSSAPTEKPFASLMAGGGGGRRRPHDPDSGAVRDRPPQWVPDAAVTTCMTPGCGTSFEMFERRHHCRYCGKIFCDKCSSTYRLMPPQWEGLCGFATRDPQRCCDPCAMELGPHQGRWIDQNCNANRSNELADDVATRYLNSPMRFTLGGEVRKAGYSLKNITDGINYWERDAQYFYDQLQGARGLLFLTIAKVAFIGGVRIGTGLVIARLPDGSWSAPCAVGSMGFTFGAAVGAAVTDMVTAVDDALVSELADAHTTKLEAGIDASLALGPLGRTAAAEAVVATDASAATSTSYAQSRGFYGGVTVDGAYLKVRDDVNLKFYGKHVSASDLLRGAEAQPPAAQPLYEQLHAFYAAADARQQAAVSEYAGGYANAPPPPPPSAADPFGGSFGDTPPSAGREAFGDPFARRGSSRSDGPTVEV